MAVRNSGRGTVTIKMIAEEVGMSFATVSKALNDSDLVKPETKKMIRAKAAEMGYTPNMLARSLRGKSTKMIAVIINDTVNSVISQVISNVSVEMNKYGYTLLTADPHFNGENERNIIQSILEKQPDFVIYAPTSSNHINVEMFSALGDRLLVLGKDTSVQHINCNTVFVDYEAGGYMSASTLMNYGHRDMIVLTEPLDFPISAQFVDGVRRAFRERGLAFDDRRIMEVYTSVESGNQAIASLWDAAANAFRLPFTAVITFCDIVAHGVYRGMKSLGKRIPEDISVIGFDDNPLNEFSNPPLASIKLPADHIARCCNDIIRAKLIDKRDDLYHFSVMPYLVPRPSAGPLQLNHCRETEPGPRPQ